MPKAYSGDLRVRVIEMVRAGASRREAADVFFLAASTAVKWLQRWEKRVAAPRQNHAAVVSRRWKCMQRQDVVRARRKWIREQGLLDPARLVFIDESVLQSTEGVQHELKPFVKLRERWGRAPRDWLSGAGLKSIRAAAVKSRGSERRIKSSDQTEQVSVRKTNESEPSDDASL